jgi:hypothetical protein
MAQAKERIEMRSFALKTGYCYNIQTMDAQKAQAKIFEWSALEYEDKERSRDWFWALGVIVVTGSIASIIFENYFFAALLILGGFLLGFFAIKKPEVITYELGPEGLRAKNHLYPYENIKAFWVQADFSPESLVRPILFIHSERTFMPVISIPIHLDSAETIHEIMSSYEIPEVEMKEHASEKIMEALGF